MQSLQGKNAIVTGAGKGLGKAITIALAQEGVNIGLIGRTEKEVNSFVKSLKTTTKLTDAELAKIYARFRKNDPAYKGE